MIKRFGIGVAAVLTVCLPASALAEPASSGFRTTTVVPEFCQISSSPLVASDAEGTLRGNVLEMCNSQHGFAVVAMHRPLQSQEQVDFEYAGTRRALNADGWSEVVRRSGARYGVRDIRVRYASLHRPLTINLTVTAF